MDFLERASSRRFSARGAPASTPRGGGMLILGLFFTPFWAFFIIPFWAFFLLHFGPFPDSACAVLCFFPFGRLVGCMYSATRPQSQYKGHFQGARSTIPGPCPLPERHLHQFGPFHGLANNGSCMLRRGHSLSSRATSTEP